MTVVGVGSPLTSCGVTGIERTGVCPETKLPARMMSVRSAVFGRVARVWRTQFEIIHSRGH